MNKAEYTRRFGSLKWWKASNRFNEVQRVAEDGSACIVRVSESMVPTIKKLVLDRTHILYLGMWQVNQNWFSAENGLTDGVEVLIKRDEFKPVETPNERLEFGIEEKNLSYETWFKAAQDQKNNGIKCYWSR